MSVLRELLSSLVNPILEPLGTSLHESRALAAVVILTDVAYVDNEFSPEERERIISFATEAFQISVEHAKHLIAEASSLLEKEESLDSYAEYLHNVLAPQERVELYQLIRETLEADGVVHPFEDWLRSRYASLLGVPDYKE
ncbi:MAG: TerB family tellurite resistance protein [Bdellovibrionales bacterium]|nr:TerB family tellurite resistance protein [Bdellovibrionales bacterium]